MTKTTNIQTAKLANGTSVRIQQRGRAFDVVRNTTGYAWTYVERGVTLERARFSFDLITLRG